MSSPGPPSPFWLLLFGLAALCAGFFGLIDGSVQVPSSFLISGRLERASQPAAYWALTALYLAAAAAFLWLWWQRRFEPSADEPVAPRRPSPPWARGLAWAGMACSVLLIGAAVAFHFALGPIVSLMFVAFFGGAGLLIGLASLGYLLTGRVE